MVTLLSNILALSGWLCLPSLIGPCEFKSLLLYVLTAKAFTLVIQSAFGADIFSSHSPILPPHQGTSVWPQIHYSCMEERHAPLLRHWANCSVILFCTIATGTFHCFWFYSVSSISAPFLGAGETSQLIPGYTKAFRKGRVKQFSFLSYTFSWLAPKDRLWL